MTHLRIGEPGRHLLAYNGDLDGLGPRPRLSVAHQGERCDLPGTMAGLTVLLQNWQDVLIERKPWCLSGTDNGQCAYRQGENTQTRHGKSPLANRVCALLNALSMIRNDYPSASDHFDRKDVGVAKSKAAFFASGLNANTELSKASRDRGAVKPSNLDGEMRKARLLPSGRGF